MDVGQTKEREERNNCLLIIPRSENKEELKKNIGKYKKIKGDLKVKVRDIPIREMLRVWEIQCKWQWIKVTRIMYSKGALNCNT